MDKGLPISVFWFRRDLRLDDNVGLGAALRSGFPVLPVFIFDTDILENLPEDDARVTFIYQQLKALNEELVTYGSSLYVAKGSPVVVWKNILSSYEVKGVFYNRDYEPEALKRDAEIQELCNGEGIPCQSYKDHVFFEMDEIMKNDGTPYTVFTAYKNKWLERFNNLSVFKPLDEKKVRQNFYVQEGQFPSIRELGFKLSHIMAPGVRLEFIEEYDKYRDFPGANRTTFSGHHLRFGTISIRKMVYIAEQKNQVFLSELIWRDFFSQILYHFPRVVNESFKKAYDRIQWENNQELFQKWCDGNTGYPIVDAGMNQLNQTGFMHNRVRMIVASFLVKHLLIDWRWGETYFAEKLLDFDLASNNGNWQWAAGCGCDAAPYFRVFNPTIQQQKFDPQGVYIRTWIPDYDPSNYLPEIVDHKFARDRVIKRFREALGES